jgi:ATPase, YjeE family
MERVIIIESIDNVADAAEQFLAEVTESNIIALYGAMGAGKTTLIKAVCKALGVEESVTSPTFTIVNEYRTPENEPIYHFDFYRIEKLSEAFDIGFEEFIESDNLCLIEWPEKVEQILPENTLRVKIEVTDDGQRRLIF